MPNFLFPKSSENHELVGLEIKEETYRRVPFFMLLGDEEEEEAAEKLSTICKSQDEAMEFFRVVGKVYRKEEVSMRMRGGRLTRRALLLLVCCRTTRSAGGSRKWPKEDVTAGCSRILSTRLRATSCARRAWRSLPAPLPARKSGSAASRFAGGIA